MASLVMQRKKHYTDKTSLINNNYIVHSLASENLHGLQREKKSRQMFQFSITVKAHQCARALVRDTNHTVRLRSPKAS